MTPFLLLFVMRFKKAVKKATHEVRHRQSDIVAVVQEGLESMRVVKAYGREQLEEEHLKQASQAAVDAALKARRIKSVLSPVVTVVVSFCTAFVLYRGASLILRGAMTIGALTVFLSYLNKFFKPVQDLAKMTNSIAQAAVGVERVQSILAADEMILERPDAREPQGVKGEITFDKVAFSYKPDSPVLKEITFTIQPGQLVGFVGATGGGKSTVASLIPRFYDATAGRVLIDGVDVRDYRLQSAPQPDRLRPAGHGPLRGDDRGEHRVRPARRDARGRRGGGQARQRRRVHREDAEGLRQRGRRARDDALGGPAAAHRHRPRDHPQLADPDPRRAHGGSRHRVGEGRHGGPRAADEGAHRHRDRASAEHDPRRRQDRRLQGRLRRGAGHARRALRNDGLYAELYRIQFPSAPGPAKPAGVPTS